jgi:hypothetical protein
MSVEIKKEDSLLRRPFLIAARRGDRTTPSLISSEHIAVIEPRSGSEKSKTYVGVDAVAATNGLICIDAPIAVVTEIFTAHGYAVYDSDALAALKKKHAAKKLQP